jgi:hypothetical protein
MKKTFSLLIALALVLSFSVVGVPAGVVGASTSTINVSQPVQVTSNSYYERGQSIVYDGSNYWLFYGRSVSVQVSYDSGNPDTHDYEIYYKKASTVAGLAGATPTLLVSTHNANIYLGETDSAYYGGKVRVYAAVDVGATCTLYQFWTDDGGSSWTENTIVTGMPDGAAHFAVTSCDGKLWFAYQEGNDWNSKYWDGSWHGAYDITNNYGTAKFYVEGTNLYFVRADSGDQDIFEWNGTSWTLKDSAAESGPWDPTIYKVGSNYVCAYAPWDGTKQYIKAKVNTDLNHLLDLTGGTEVDITAGGYSTTNPWVDMWPTGFTDNGGDTYLFYTSERNPSDTSSEIAGNIWYLKVDWPVTNDHYTYIQNAVDYATSTTINLAPGTYGPFTVVGKTNLTIQASGAVTVQGVQVVTTNYGNRDAVVFISGSTNIVLDGLTIGPNSGQTQKDYGVIYEQSSGKIKDCTVSPQTSGDMDSVAIGIWDSSDVDIDPCIIKDFGRIGVFVYNGCTVDVLDSTIEGQVYSGVNEVCYGIEVEAASASASTACQVTIDGCEIYNCDNTYPSGPNWASGGIYINGWLQYQAQADSTVITRCCDIHDNYHGIIAIMSSLSSAHYNNIYDNRVYGADIGAAHDGSTANFDAENNWWGDTDGSGPYDPAGETIAGWPEDTDVPPCGVWVVKMMNTNGTGDEVHGRIDYCPWLDYSAATTTGAGNASFTCSHGCINNLTAVSPTPPNQPVDLPYGVFSFNISCIDPGETVTVTVTLPGPVPVGSVWWKYQNGSWYWLPIGDDDGDNVITVTLTDGGQGDADGIQNGEIIDDGGSGLLCRGLIIRSTEGGRVTKPGEGHHLYDHGTVVKLVATPDDGYKFVAWTHDVRRIDDVNAAETTITMDWSYVVIANFVTVETSTVETEVQYDLTVSSTMGGSVSTPGEGTFPYIEGSMVSLVAKPATGYKFVNWTGDGITNPDSTTVTVTMNGDYSIKANFEFEQTTDTDSGGESSVPVVACFIATAAYGTSTVEQIDVLREFRDVVLLENSLGSQFVDLYYRLSPPIADFIAGNSFLRTVVRELVIDPVVWMIEATGVIWRN